MRDPVQPIQVVEGPVVATHAKHQLDTVTSELHHPPPHDREGGAVVDPGVALPRPRGVVSFVLLGRELDCVLFPLLLL